MFVFPMLGRSSRFFNAGYTVPKYKLPLGEEGQLVFDHVLGSFKDYFESDLFVLMCRADAGDRQFLCERLQSLGVRRFDVIEHAGETRGQAESVELALGKALDDEELFIFNIDTVLYNFQKSPKRASVSGYLEVFRGEGTHWSFVEPDASRPGFASKVVEKDRISDLCSNGLYFFDTVRTYKQAVAAYRAHHPDATGELYVAPLYNELINKGLLVGYTLVPVSDIGFCGVPDEYLALRRVLNPA